MKLRKHEKEYKEVYYGVCNRDSSLVSFFGLVVYAVRGGNLMLGIFVMGIISDGSANDWQYVCYKSGFYSSK